MNLNFNWSIEGVALETQKLVETKIQEKLEQEPQQENTEYIITISKDQYKPRSVEIVVYDDDNSVILEGYIQVLHNRTQELWSDSPLHLTRK